MKYTSKLQECASEYARCRECKGLVECQNEIKGYIFAPLVEDDRLTFSYNACHYEKEQIKKHKYQENIYYFDIPKEVKEAKMSNIFTSDKNRIEAIAWLKDFINNYKNNEASKGLYLYGNFGSGKTYLISAMLNELAKVNHKVAIIYWPEFLRDLKASFDDDFAGKYNYIKKIPLLLIDDIGAENSTAWARDEILGPLLQYRIQENLTTFFTSNLSLEELEMHFSNTGYKVEQVKAKRIIERIKQLSIEMKMISKNNRE
jgi:primosomal protein DnaI